MTWEGDKAAEKISAFAYGDGPAAAAPCWDAWGGAVPEETGTVAADAAGPPVLTPSDWERRLKLETQKSFDAGREAGRQEGRAAEKDAQAAGRAAATKERNEQAAHLVKTFADQRERYLADVEPEVVKLALAVAARILRRESQMDPLLLTGAVRVALGQLAVSTQVSLRVPPADLELWTEAMALLPNAPVKPQVIPADGMRLGDCVIETTVGSVDLGVRAQLNEIERGFFDKTGSPAVPSDTAVEDR